MRNMTGEIVTGFDERSKRKLILIFFVIFYKQNNVLIKLFAFSLEKH